MKKSIALVALLAAVSSVHADAPADQYRVVTINGARLANESKQGQALQERLQNQSRQLQEYQQKMVAELQEKSNKLVARAKIMDPAAYQAELLALRMEERQLERDLRGKQEDLQLQMQQEQEILRRSVTVAANDVLESKKLGAIVDISVPGGPILASSKSLDETNAVMEKLNADFDAAVSSKNVQVAQAATEAPVTA